MNLKRGVLALLVGSVALWGVAQESESGPRSLEARWEEAQNEGNLGAIAELFTEDAWFSPFDGTTLGGIEAIRAFFTAEGGSPAGGPRIEITPEEHTVVGELAYGYGTYALWTPDGTRIAAGNYLGTYRKEGDEWRIHHYMGNAVVPKEQEAAPATSAPSNAELGERFAAIFNEQDLSIADEVFAPDFVAHVTVSPTPTLDRKGWKAYLGGFRASFPDLRLDVKDMVTTGDMVILRVVLRGTQTGPFQDLPPSGKAVAFDGVAMHRVENSQIVEHWGVMDLLSLMQQLTEPETARGRSTGGKR